MEEVLALAREILAYRAVRAVLWIVGAIIVGRITDILLCRAVMQMARRTRSDLDERLIGHLHRPIFVTVVLIGIYLAVLQFELDATVMALIVSAVQTIGIIVWLSASLRIAGVVVDGLNRLAGRVPWIETSTIPLFGNIAKLIIFGGAIYGLLVAWKLDLAPWLASAGVAGIAIGFAAKDSLANLFGGLFVIVDRPYSIGDYINLGSGERGRVTQIGLRSTRILTRDEVEVTVPNAQIANSTIVNESGGPTITSRVRIFVGVAYGSNIDQVRTVLQEAADSADLVLKDPAPRIRFTEMGDSALIFRVLCYIAHPEQRGRCVDQLNTAVYNALHEAGINIPFPQRELHFHQPLVTTGEARP